MGESPIDVWKKRLDILGAFVNDGLAIVLEFIEGRYNVYLHIDECDIIAKSIFRKGCKRNIYLNFGQLRN
jgi:hypothetical protein